MLYYGGKSRISLDIVRAIEAHTRERVIYEPFCGGCSVTLTFALRGWAVFPSDFNEALVNCVNSTIDGWRPELVDWDVARKLPDSDPRKAFVGIFCSYSGFWFKRFEPSLVNGSTVTLQATANHFKRKGVRLTHAHYLTAFSKIPDNSIVYCDPPYRVSREGYDCDFDYVQFSNAISCLADRGCKVFVSEYQSPCIGARSIWTLEQKRSFSGKASTLKEHLFLLDK